MTTVLRHETVRYIRRQLAPRVEIETCAICGAPYPAGGGRFLCWNHQALVPTLSRANDTERAPSGTLNCKPAASPVPTAVENTATNGPKAAILFVGATGFEPATPCPPVSRVTAPASGEEVP